MTVTPTRAHARETLERPPFNRHGRGDVSGRPFATFAELVDCRCADCHGVWAEQHRASATPLLAWALALLVVGAIAGASIAGSVLSSKVTGPEAGDLSRSGSIPSVAVEVGGSTVRASSVEVPRSQVRISDGPSPASESGFTGPTREDSATTIAAPTTDVRTSVRTLITTAAAEFSVDPQTMLRRAFCESTYDPDAVGKAQEVSIFQFLPSTWKRYAPRLGYTLREIGHVEAQARVAAYMESIGEGGQWSCQ